MTARYRTLVFAVNEALSDMSAMTRRFVDVGASPDLAQVWFTGVLRDGFAVTVAGNGSPSWQNRCWAVCWPASRWTAASTMPSIT